MAVKHVIDASVGKGLVIAGAKVQVDLGVGLVFNGNKIDVQGATIPLTVALSTPGGANLQAAVNGNNSNVLDLTPLVQAAETNTTMTYNPATKTLTYTSEDGVVSNADLSALAMDIFVSGGSFDAGTMVLTLTDNDGTTPDITVNLAELKKVVTAASSTVSWSGTGEASDPLIANIKLGTIPGNLLTVGADGLQVDPAAIAVTSGVGISGDGKSATPLEFAADELPTPAIDTQNPDNNFVMSTPLRLAGQLVPVAAAGEAVWIAFIESQVNNLIAAHVPAVVQALMTVDVQDLAGNHLYYALP